MHSFRQFSLCLVAAALVLSSCAFNSLRKDLGAFVQEYGFFAAQIDGIEDGTDILVGLFRREQGSLSVTNFRTVNSGETLYMLVPKADYTLFAFSDSNGDFIYQAGEPAVRVDDPFVNWFVDMQLKGSFDFESLLREQFRLSSTVVLEQHLDYSLATLRKDVRAAENLLRVVSWDDEIFSPENSKRGLWEPSWFENEIGYGLFVLEEFDPTKKSILLVHGITDSPRVFKNLANSIPADYQLLLFYYPSGFPLEFTSGYLNAALDELVRRDQIPQLDIIAHSMGGLISKGMLAQANEALRKRLRLFISIASPFGGHASAGIGTKWSPVVAPVWWAMVPGSDYLQTIDALDLSQGPIHHLIFAFSRTADGKSVGDDGVATVKSQLAGSAQLNAAAIYGIADNHKGVTENACTTALVTAILQDGTTRVSSTDC